MNSQRLVYFCTQGMPPDVIASILSQLLVEGHVPRPVDTSDALFEVVRRKMRERPHRRLCVMRNPATSPIEQRRWGSYFSDPDTAITCYSSTLALCEYCVLELWFTRSKTKAWLATGRPPAFLCYAGYVMPKDGSIPPMSEENVSAERSVALSI